MRQKDSRNIRIVHVTDHVKGAIAMLHKIFNIQIHGIEY